MDWADSDQGACSVGVEAVERLTIEFKFALESRAAVRTASGRVDVQVGDPEDVFAGAAAHSVDLHRLARAHPCEDERGLLVLLREEGVEESTEECLHRRGLDSFWVFFR